MVTKLSSTSTAGSLAHSPALARVREAGLVLAGTLSLILIGQITIPLPFTPVPISMGTFAALGVGAMGRGVQRAATLYRRAGGREVSVILYPGGRHELLNETNRDQVTGDILTWIDGHL